jgi:uncharacterized protein (DUF1810 family)
MEQELDRFLKAQENTYEQALAEIKSGRKYSHWMWFIFPQYIGLGVSETSRFYAIRSIDEAKAYLAHPILGARLRQISNELLLREENHPNRIFGNPDDLKLQSCMTLFSSIDTSEAQVFQKVLDQYFQGKADQKSIDNPGI